MAAAQARRHPISKLRAAPAARAALEACQSGSRSQPYGLRPRRTRALAQLLLKCRLGQLAGIDPELLLEHGRMLFVVDLVGQLLEGLLYVLVLALLPKQIDHL